MVASPTLFETMVQGYYAEVKAEQALAKILSVELLGISFDHYDSSFEIYPDFEDAVMDLVVTAEQHQAILALGCQRYWINFRDGTERYCTNERKKSGYPRWEHFDRNLRLRRSELEAARHPVSQTVEAKKTRLIPVYRPTLTDPNPFWCLTPAQVPASTYVDDTGSFATMPFKMGAHFSLLGCSQTDYELYAGLSNTTAMVSAVPSMPYLNALYVRCSMSSARQAVREEVFKIDVPPGQVSFEAATEGSRRLVGLHKKISIAFSPKTTKTTFGESSELLLLSAPWLELIQLQIELSGRISLDLGDTIVSSSRPKIQRYGTDETPFVGPSPTQDEIDETMALIESSLDVIGYELFAEKQ